MGRRKQSGLLGTFHETFTKPLRYTAELDAGEDGCGAGEREKEAEKERKRKKEEGCVFDRRRKKIVTLMQTTSDISLTWLQQLILVRNNIKHVLQTVDSGLVLRKRGRASEEACQAGLVAPKLIFLDKNKATQNHFMGKLFIYAEGLRRVLRFYGWLWEEGSGDNKVQAGRVRDRSDGCADESNLNSCATTLECSWTPG